MSRVLCVNPGSTSTKVAVFDDEALVCAEVVRHDAAELAALGRIAEQAPLRLAVVTDALAAAGVDLGSLDAVVGRGGLVRPIPGGTYAVTPELLADLTDAPGGEHASNLGGMLAAELASAATRAALAQRPADAPRAPDAASSRRSSSVPAFVVDPVVVDEFDALARYSGHPEIERRSIFHALNQKATAHRYASQVGRPYAELNLIVAHLGGGISVGAHRRGRVVDVNNALDGDGPFGPERAGGLPTASWAKLALTKTAAETKKLLTGGGGLASLLGTSDAREVERRAAAGDAEAAGARDAMCYQTAKEIGSCAAVLRGDVDAVCLTGGLAYDETIVAEITRLVGWIAPVAVFPGEDELPALRDGALRVLRGEETARDYAAEVRRG